MTADDRNEMTKMETTFLPLLTKTLHLHLAFEKSR